MKLTTLLEFSNPKEKVKIGGKNWAKWPGESNLTPAAITCLHDVVNFIGEENSRNIGGYNYRTIGGSSALSEHAYGNALDFHPANLDKSIGDRIVQYLLDNKDILQIENIIYYRQIWERYLDFKVKPYHGQNPHTDHVHVDFIRNKNNKDNKDNTTFNTSINKYVTDLIAAYYDISTKNPEAYFKSFRSWNPLSPGIGDNEEGAANKLIGRFLKIYEPKLSKLEKLPTINKKDKDNIQILRSVVDKLTDSILRGKSTKFVVRYNAYDKSTNSYKIKTLQFDWNYL